MNLALNLTDEELLELRRQTKVTDDADAVSRAAREFLRICRARELTSIAGTVDYDENAWREMDQAELAQREMNIDR
jgi:hypothetical protein